MIDAKNLKITYIGGGSRGWATNLIIDLAKEPSLCGTVHLYDIDVEAANKNAIIGNSLIGREDVKSNWKYVVETDAEEALKDANFVIMSILPGTFDEMQSDVHTPEKYGIWQSVGDSSGPGGIVRAMRTVPIYRGYAKLIKKCCPNAFVINFTNPMTLCVRALYEEFPEIKAFGCCHEVFGTQKLFTKILETERGIKAERDDIKVNVMGINHFTWLDKVTYMGEDLIPLYKEAIEKNSSAFDCASDDNWINNVFATDHSVKRDLFKRYGIVAAAGDRHLAEFVPGKWYLKDPDTVKSWHFGLTTVNWRQFKDLPERIEKQNKRASGEEKLELYNTGEESVRQMKAILGLGDIVTNVNLPNRGQIPNLPLDAVVETNAYFTAGQLTPVFAGAIPMGVNSLVSKIVSIQEEVLKGIFAEDYERVFNAFIQDPNVQLDIDTARTMFDEMLEKTKKYLPKSAYDKYLEGRKNTNIR